MRCATTRRTCSALLVFALAFGAAAQPANRDLDRIRGDIARLKERLEDVRRKARTAEQELEVVDLELDIRTRELQVALDVQAQLERERAGLEQQIAVLVTRITDQKTKLRKRLVALYRLGGLSYLRLFLSLADQRDPSSAISMLGFLIHHDSVLINGFQTTRSQLATRNVELLDRQKKIAAATRVIDQRRREIAATVAAKERLLASLRVQETGSEQQLAELEEKARRLERLVDMLSKQQGGMIPESDVRTFRGALAWPVEGKVVEQFGRQRNAKFATFTMNNGLKIEAATRSPVRAVFQGTVLFSQWFKGYGNLIILDHGNRVFSLYGNLIAPAVKVGDAIVTGQAIAGVGEGEETQSGYLYFEIREDNRPEDPQKWLR